MATSSSRAVERTHCAAKALARGFGIEVVVVTFAVIVVAIGLVIEISGALNGFDFNNA